ncbi:MAG: copper chaperone PCu(A)C [Rubrimonas sp.]
MNLFKFAAALCAAAPGFAVAHAALDGEAAPGHVSELAVRIGHGCDGLDVTGLEPELPEGFVGLRPMRKPGWTVAVCQFCGDVEVAWTDLAAPGQHHLDLPFPAPVLKVAGGVPVATDHHHAHAAAEGAAKIGDLAIANAFARAPAAPGGASAAYLTITTTGAADRLIAASSPDAARVELHDHVVDDAGVARMREVEAIDVRPDAPAELKPGGLHVMLMGPRADMAAGQAITLTLTFETAGEVTFDVPVIAAGRGQADAHGGHGQHHGHSHGN